MKTATLVALSLLAACSVPTRTAYNSDHTKSWMCVPNTQIQYPPLRGEPPLVMVEPADGAPQVAKK